VYPYKHTLKGCFRLTQTFAITNTRREWPFTLTRVKYSRSKCFSVFDNVIMFIIMLRCVTVCLLSVTQSYCTFQTLVVSLVLTRLDYGNSILAGLPISLVQRLQSVLNTAAGDLSPVAIEPHLCRAGLPPLAARP